MENGHHIKTFTALDIEKYHKGLLSSKEMHELEKAALDDPFLADALEGYGVTPVNVAGDLVELKKRLEKRTTKNKAIPLSSRSSFPWLRIAAMIVLIAGAGFLVYQFAFTNKREDIAQAPNQQPGEAAKTTSPVQAAPAPLTDSVEKANQKQEVPQVNVDQNANKPTLQDNAGIVNPPSPQHSENQDDSRNLAAAEDNAIKDKKETDERKNKKTDIVEKEIAPATLPAREQTVTSEPFYMKGKTVQRARNLFQGRVTDSHNNALPFANITNIADSVGTYTDVKGNFVLTSPDSVLNVQVRSLGFENSIVQLQNQAAASNRVIMQDDNSVSQLVLSNRRANVSRSRNNVTVEEPDPIDDPGRPP